MGGFIEIKNAVPTRENSYEITYPNGVVVRSETNNVQDLSTLVNLY